MASSKHRRIKHNRGQKKKKKTLPSINNLELTDELVDFDKLVKNEHQRLLREYRLMEDERHIMVAKGRALSKQARILDLLYDEVKDLKTDLYSMNSSQNQESDEKNKRTILNMLESYERAQDEHTVYLKNIHEMCFHVDRIVKYLIAHRLKVQAVYGTSMSYAQMEKKRRILENRLYFYTTKFDQKICENKRIRREEITLSLKLRGLFHARHMSLKKQLGEIRNKMAEVVFLATQAYDLRDDHVLTARIIRERNDRDNKQHLLEMKEFNRILHHDAAATAFLKLKTIARQMAESEKQRSLRKNRSKFDELERRLHVYTNSFYAILSKSNFTTLESLILHYNEMMQQNFSMFRYNCDINQEIASLRDETLEMSNSIESLFQESEQRKENNETELNNGRFRIALTQNKLEEIQVVLSKAELNMDEVMELLAALFSSVGCSREIFASYLDSSGGFKIWHAMFCLEMIERRARELLFEQLQLEARETVEILKQNIKEPRAIDRKSRKFKTPGGPYVPNILVSRLMDDEEDEEEERLIVTPQSEAQIRQAIIDRMKPKKESVGSLSVQASSSIQGKRSPTKISTISLLPKSSLSRGASKDVLTKF